MKIPAHPIATKLNVRPKFGHSRTVFHLDQHITLDDGRETHYVLISSGYETIIEDNFAVFACDAEGKVLEWDAIYSESEGPEWCLDLIDLAAARS